MSMVIKTDPICGMVVEPGENVITYTYAGCTHLFCFEECLERFTSSPEAYVTFLAHNHSACVGQLCRYLSASSQPHLRVGISQP